MSTDSSYLGYTKALVSGEQNDDDDDNDSGDGNDDNEDQ